MNGLPDKVIWNGPSLIGGVLMMFTDEVTGTTFSLKPEEATPSNIAAHAVTVRGEQARQADQFAEAADAFTSGIADMIEAAKPDAEIIAELREQLATAHQRLKTQGETHAYDLKLKNKIIQAQRLELDVRDIQEDSEQTYEQNAADRERY